jgi:hypothetical protein
MWTKASVQNPESAVQRLELRSERVGDTCLKPANCACAHAAENDAIVPGVTQRFVDPVYTPYGEQICRVASTDVNQVAGSNRLSRVGDGSVEEAEVRRFAPILTECSTKSLNISR